MQFFWQDGSQQRNMLEKEKSERHEKTENITVVVERNENEVN